MRSPFTLATVLAHPDDETFGVGGTLIRYAREGVAVHSLCLTKGEQGWAGDPESPIVPREKVGETRAAELHEAGRRMGLASVTALDWPDGKLSAADPRAVRDDIVGWLERIKPDVVITWGPDGGYGHPDHIRCGQLALDAIAAGGTSVKRCYRFVASAEFLDEMPKIYPGFSDYMKSLEVKPERWTADRIDCAIDIGPYLDQKWHSMQAHRTQAPDLKAWADARERGLFGLFGEECFIRALPVGSVPVEHDLFAALRGAP